MGTDRQSVLISGDFTRFSANENSGPGGGHPGRGRLLLRLPLTSTPELNIAGTRASEQCGEGVKQATNRASAQDREVSGK